MIDSIQVHNGQMLNVYDGEPDVNDRRYKMKEMKNHVEEVCKVLREKHMIQYENRSKAPNSTDLPMQVMISEDFKLIGCKVLKVGSTNLKRLLYTLDNLKTLNDTNESSKALSKEWNIGVGSIQGEQLSEMRQKLKTYTTFMFVREPLERLMSAYRNGKPYGWFPKQNLPSFIEYLGLIIKTPTRILNKHLKLYSTWCQPCSIKYDFIGTLDNFDEDMGLILESVGANHLAILPKRNQTGYRSAKSSNVVQEYRKTIPREILKAIYQKYYVDYYMFGFPRPY